MRQITQILFMSLALHASSCMPAPTTGPPSTKVYYGWLASYAHPVTLSHKISKHQAHSSGSFYVGTFDIHGRLVVAEQWADGELLLRYEYEYDADGEPVLLSSGAPGKSVTKPLPTRPKS